MIDQLIAAAAIIIFITVAVFTLIMVAAVYHTRKEIREEEEATRPRAGLSPYMETFMCDECQYISRPKLGYQRINSKICQQCGSIKTSKTIGQFVTITYPGRGAIKTHIKYGTFIPRGEDINPAAFEIELRSAGHE